MLGAKRVTVAAETLHLDAHGRQQLDELQHIEDLRHVVHHHPLGREQHSTQYLQRFVFGSLRFHAASEAGSALYSEYGHTVCRFCFM